MAYFWDCYINMIKSGHYNQLLISTPIIDDLCTNHHNHIVMVIWPLYILKTYKLVKHHNQILMEI